MRGSAVIPLWDTMNPRRRLVGTQKTHLKGFNWILYLRHRRKACRKSSMCCVCFYDRAWDYQDKPRWCGWGHGNNMSWHAGRWLQHFWGQRAWLGRKMCPMGLWMPFCNGLLSGFGFGCNQKIYPWRRRPCVWRMHRWSGRWIVCGSCLWDMPHQDRGFFCKRKWYPIFYSWEQD